ncbi:MAG: OmpW family protein, partial [Alphaproteobacteria bacterium]|nr:OmpW family protein [Alphaproteobacteria bacterium]
LDVKKLWLDVDASLNNGAIQADVDMDPWIVGAGVSYRF